MKSLLRFISRKQSVKMFLELVKKKKNIYIYIYIYKLLVGLQSKNMFEELLVDSETKSLFGKKFLVTLFKYCENTCG